MWSPDLVGVAGEAFLVIVTPKVAAAAFNAAQFDFVIVLMGLDGQTDGAPGVPPPLCTVHAMQRPPGINVEILNLHADCCRRDWSAFVGVKGGSLCTAPQFRAAPPASLSDVVRGAATISNSATIRDSERLWPMRSISRGHSLSTYSCKCSGTRRHASEDTVRGHVEAESQ